MRTSVSLLALPLIAAGLSLPLAGASAAPSGPRLRGGVEHVYLASTCANCQGLSFLATGAVTDYGHTAGNGAGKITLKKGDWKVNTSGFKEFLIANNTTSCWYKYGIKGPAVITGGTGPYRGIKGTLEINITYVGIGARLANGACNQSNNAPDLATVGYGSGVGTIRF